MPAMELDLTKSVLAALDAEALRRRFNLEED